MTSGTEKQPVAAFIDFDETLLAIDSAGIGFKLLKEQGYLTRGFMLKMMLVLFLFKLGLLSDQAVARSMLSFYKGRELQPFVDSADAFYAEYLKPNLSPAMLNRLSWHQQQGHHTVLLTGSIDYYLKPVVKDLQIDHLLCTHLETGENGRLTGRSRGPVCVGAAKVKLALDLAKDLGVDLAASYAYGNSHLDIPILEKVGHPVMVNPSQTLQKHGEKQSWPLL